MSLNPIIAAFLTARGQANEQFGQQQRAQQFQERLQFEKEAQEAENELRFAQLQQLVNKAKIDAEQFKTTSDLNTKKYQADAYKTLADLVSGGKMTREAGSATGASLGLSPELISQLPTYQDVKAAETQAKLDELKALMGPSAEAKGMEAKAVSEARQPNLLEIEQMRAQDRKEIEQFKSGERKTLEEYKQSQANARAASRNAANAALGKQATLVNRIASAHDSHPVSKDIADRLASYNAIKLIDPNTKNPGDDISLVTQFAKIIDPSVVRPSEYETVRKYFQGLPANIQAQVKRLVNSGGSTFLSPDARKSLRTAAGGLMRGQVSVYLPYRKAQIDRINQATGQDIGEDYVGTGFMPEEVKNVGGKYYWVEGGKAIPLYGGK